CTTWPVIPNRSPSRLDCFALGDRWELRHIYWTSSVWRGSENLEGFFIGGIHEPSCVSWKTGRIDCYANTDPSVGAWRAWHRYWDGLSWQPPTLPSCPALPTPLLGDGTDNINVRVYRSNDSIRGAVGLKLTIAPDIDWWKAVNLA